MKQVSQNFKSGELSISEVSIPNLMKGMVLVENHNSLISAGTEKSTVQVAKANLLDKARQRPDLVAQVMQNIKKEGLGSTLRKVKNKLDSPKALGYSSAGKVVASMDKLSAFKPGDRVACAGQDYASHAEVVTVPQNLVAKIPDNVSFEEAAFTTLGSIALQGIRQADVKFGEHICVIGLGVLGQITCQLLRASGCMVYGIDLSSKLVEFAKENSSDVARKRSDPNLIQDAWQFTNNLGFDKVIITASTTTNDPVNLAAEISRKKGCIVIVGSVGMDIKREPHFYKKELEIKMSCSYGPGRYDPEYEELGKDYPVAYVRWTEQRNMQAFLKAVSKNQLNLKPLITHVYEINEAQKAYDLLLGKSEDFHLGVLLEYLQRPEKFLEIKEKYAKMNEDESINIAFIGAGSFAQSYLLPNINKNIASLDTVLTSKGINSGNVAEKFGFKRTISDTEKIWNSPEINTVFICTRHDTHAQYTVDSLKSGKNVFVEKPLALNMEELEEIVKVYNSTNSILFVGFNRRFSTSASIVKDFFKNLHEPKLMNFRINSGDLPNDHWIQQDEIGGGRIIGEICHFIDLMQHFCDSMPVQVYAESLPGKGPNRNDDKIAIVLKFSDGSLGNIMYVSNGSPMLPKEYIEIFAGAKTAIIDDFKIVKLLGGTSSKKIKTSGKGHKEEIRAFLSAITDGQPSPIPFQSILLTTNTTFAIKDSLATGLPQVIQEI